MAAKDDLEAREVDCSSAADYVALAREALAEPADADYTKDLLEKAELECQFPGEYVDVAEAAHGADLVEYADELYEQAEDACFEAGEFARLGQSLGSIRGDKEKAREMLEKAAAEAKALPDFLKIAQYAREALGDDEFAGSLLAKVEGDCQSIEDYKKLAGSVLGESGDAESARTFYGKAEKFAMDLPSTIAYAEGAAEIFDDKAWIGEILEEVESDCQFTKEFVTLADAYHRLTGDAEKVGELIEQAEEFAMTGEEQVQLAEAAFKLLGDREKAKEAYEKALGEISGRDELFGLAATIATELEDQELAGKVYAKVEGSLGSAADACKLARAVKSDLGDEEFVRGIYERAEQKFDAPADALVLAKDVLEVTGDRDRAAGLFKTCLAGTHGFADLGKLLDTVRAGVESDELNREVLTKLAGAAQKPTELLSTADRAIDVLEDRELAASLLDRAEERVTTLPEMKGVVEAVDRHLADDEERVSRVKEKLEKREANQGRYDEFQKREAELVTCRQFLALTAEVMAELDDRYYAAKLLSAAEEKLAGGIFEVGGYRELILAVGTHLGDQETVRRLLDAAADRVSTFADVRALARTAAQDLPDREFGGEWAKSFLAGRADGLAARDDAGAYEYTKLAGGVFGELGDQEWAGRLLAAAEEKAATPFEVCHVGTKFAELGETGKAAALYGSAVSKCVTAGDCVRLVTSFRDLGLGEQELREHYLSGGKSLLAGEKLRWAEGILELFGDKSWAEREYVGMAGSFSAPDDKALFQASQKIHFGKTF